MKKFLPVIFLVAACSKTADTPVDAGPDLGADVGETPDLSNTDASSDDVGMVVCPNAEPCEPNERLMSDCTCRSNFDRLCFQQSDCRDTEECREVSDTVSVCWFEPDPLQKCPGSAGCDDGAGTLMAGASRKSVTPLGFETPKQDGLDGVIVKRDPYRFFSTDEWNDCGLDGLCPGDDGYTAPDEGEADGVPQGMWIAGFTTGRAAQYCAEELIGCDGVECCVSKYAHDDIEVNLVVFQQGDTTVAFAALDTVGFFHTDIARIEESVREAAGVDLLVMAATHNHEGPDTSGQWGPGRPAPTTTGRLPSFMQRIHDQTVAGIQEALANMKPAKVEAAVVDAGTDGLAIGDSRPPYIFDDNVPVVRITEEGTGAPIATMFSFGNHAEVRWSENVHLTSDYYGFARKYVREGLPETTDVNSGDPVPALDGHGGVAVAFAGAVGGLINPGRGGAKDRAGNEYEDDLRRTWEATDAVGQQLAARVLGADLQPTTNELSFATTEFLVPIENRQLELAAVALNLIERDVYNGTRAGSQVLPDGFNFALSQVAVVRLGGIDFFTAPGEVFPETLVGGFPDRPSTQNPVIGEVRGEAICDSNGLPADGGTFPCIVHADQENPPDWSMAPMPPYAYDRIPGQFPFFIGLGLDFLGYMVPLYDYEEVGYFSKAPGSHYEETNGIGRTIVEQWETGLQECVDALE